MADPRPDQTGIATFDDHQVITPPNRLRRAVKKVTVALPEDDPVTRAESALAQLSSEFSSWMFAECDRLDAARRAVADIGFSKQTIDALFTAAHDIKGEAETFGYPAVAPAAESLCRAIEHTPDPSRIPHALIDQHVDAIRAIIREYARPDVEQIASALTQKLREVTDEFLVRVNQHRPDYLQNILSPSLAPGEGF
jgi:HPt (histidine-containing phosphotransfer) domain-containing protein